MQWINLTVGEYCPFVYGKAIKKQEQYEQGIPVFGSNGVYTYSKNELVKPYAVIIGRKGTVGKVHLSPEPCWVSDTAFYIQYDSIDEARFTYYLLSTLGLEDMNTDAAVPGLNRNNAHRLEVSVPETPEQRQSLIEPLVVLDKKIELNRQTNQTLEQIAQALFKSWFVDFEPVKAKMQALENGGTEDDANLAAMQAISGKTADQLATLKTQHPDQYQQLHHTADLFPSEMVDNELGEIPKGWEVIGFEKIAQPKKGKNITKSTVIEGDVPVVAGGLQPAYYHNTPNVFSPVITVSASGANAGYVNLYHNDIWASDCSYISKGQTSYVYSVYCFLKLKQKEIYDMQQGAAQPHVYPKDLHRLQLASPENLVLWLKLEEIIMPLFSMIKNNNKESKTLEELRDTLLPKLLPGELQISTEDAA